jgi:hypothetical protein
MLNVKTRRLTMADTTRQKTKTFLYISLIAINFQFYFHISRSKLTDTSNGGDDPLIGTNNNCLLALLFYADLTDINHGSDDPLIGIEPFYPRQLTRFYS